MMGDLGEEGGGHGVPGSVYWRPDNSLSVSELANVRPRCCLCCCCSAAAMSPVAKYQFMQNWIGRACSGIASSSSIHVVLVSDLTSCVSTVQYPNISDHAAPH